MIGLGRMGGNMARRLAQRGHRVVGYSRTRATVDEHVPYGIVPAYTPEEAVAALKPPRILWFMYPAGEPTEQAIFQFAELLNAGDLVVNVTKTKKLTNIRAAGADEKMRIAPAVKFSLEEALEYIQADEYVEVTPKSIRLRKILLKESDRRRSNKS